MPLLAGAVIALVAGLAGGALALALRGDGGGAPSRRPSCAAAERRAASTRSRSTPARATASSRSSPASASTTETAGSGFVVDARARADRDRLARRHARSTSAAPRRRRRPPCASCSTTARAPTRSVLGYDLFEDTALLQVDPANLGLRALRLGRARSLRVGDAGRRDRQPVREPRLALDGRRLPARPPDRGARRVLPHDGRDPDRRRRQPGQLGRPADGRRRRASSAWSRRSIPTRSGGVAYAVPDRGRAARLPRARGRRPRAATPGSASPRRRSRPRSPTRSASPSQHGALVAAPEPGRRGARAGLQAGSETRRGRGQGLRARRRRDRRRRRDARRGLPRPRPRDRRAPRRRHASTCTSCAAASARVVPVRLLARPASFANCA